ncbi:MAG TPA: response regulator [Allosphingosinicella sp.]|uniref:response regulator n=1 Tax=Allosphingosinicella sp. TaxID=2823234 RepID=UPI002ED9FB80
MSSVPPTFFSTREPARSASIGFAGALVLVAALLSAALLLYVVDNAVFATAFFAGVLAAAALIHFRAKAVAPATEAEPVYRTDVALLRAALESAPSAAAITDLDGNLRCTNSAYFEWFGGHPAPAELPFEAEGTKYVTEAIAKARRDGAARVDGLQIHGLSLRADVGLSGTDESHLLWRFGRAQHVDLAREARRLIEGEAGFRIGEAGMMTALADDQGHIISANRAFVVRAFGDADAPLSGAPLVNLLAANERGQFHFVAEGSDGGGLRIMQVPVSEGAGALTLFVLLDDAGGFGGLGQEGSASLNALLDFLPLGLALANSDGRFVYLNKSFRKAAGIGKDARPIYPGDLVIDEDKAAVSDAVRRFARGRLAASDIAVRLKSSPEEPVALTIAGAKGLGEAAVILSLKDTSEEDRLKKQVAQATKMQAVGQLAGGVAHDFNNILTAIIGYCDLMLMRHTPGDSDYDDIQQIRSNSNRAAGLTRQLLAFSRQQTLRPQVLQLPDVIAEVSNLLKRLLGETVKLQVKHGRNLGAVRADPGQLEQVIVNLAVNARDAMLTKDPQGGGTLTLHTYSVSADDVRKMASDILPIADYTALRVTDTGTGIPANLLPKIFEPFFTTKEVGKGTGLGLSTVYGIVKQSGGFIFAESEPGKGASFVIYLPVFRTQGAPEAAKGKVKETAGELWGTGTVLLVEDEAMVRAVAERALTRHGYRVLTAENGEAALEILAREEQVDLLISDVVMPTMDGPTTVREARKTHPDLPILFISGYAEEQLRKSIDLERVAFLAKPFSVQKLAEAARDALLQK